MKSKLLKRLVRRMLSEGLQQSLRRRYVVREVFREKDLPEKEAAILPTLLAMGDHVADVGANVGNYTKIFSELVGPEGHVYAFEPILGNYEILEEVVRKGRLRNVTHQRAAVGPDSGRCEMVIPDEEGFTGYYTAHVARPGEPGRREEATLVCLDELWRDKSFPKLDFIKCDVEGEEWGVLQGGVEIIRAQHPAWLMEVGRPMSGEVFRFLQGLGYRSFVYDGKLVETESYRDKEYSNYLFIAPWSTVWRRAFGSSEQKG